MVLLIKSVKLWNQSRLFLVCLLLILFSIYPCFSAPAQNKISAQKGKIDFSKWDFSKNKLASLSGYWGFFWKEYVNPAGNMEPSEFFYIPGTWNRLNTNQGFITGYGYATFVLDISGLERLKEPALKVPVMATSYRLFWNGKLVAENGVPGTNALDTIADYAPKTIPLPGMMATNRLVLQVANYICDKGGPWNVITIGEWEQVSFLRDSNVIRTSVMIGFFLVSFLYVIALYLFNRSLRSAHYFGLFCLMSAGMLLFDQNVEVASYLPLSWDFKVRAGILLIYAAYPIVIACFYFLFSKSICKFFMQMATIISVSFIAASCLLPISWNGIILPGFHIILVISCIILSVYLIWAAKLKVPFARTSLLGFIVLVASIINDILDAGIYIRTGYIISFGVVFFIISYAVILSRDAGNHYDIAVRERLNSEQRVKEHAVSFGLTKRETEVLHLILLGQDNTAIAVRLFISPGTVKRHTHNIYFKTKVSNRIELNRLFSKA